MRFQEAVILVVSPNPRNTLQYSAAKNIQKYQI